MAAEAEALASVALTEARSFLAAGQDGTGGMGTSSEATSELIKHQTRLCSSQADVDSYTQLSSTVALRLAGRGVHEETHGRVSSAEEKVEMGASLANQGGSSLFLFAALISINLAVLNSLPLPLLDGGQFALLLLEGLRGRPLPEKFQTAFMQSGFVLLVGLSLVLIVKDTSQLPMVQQLFGR